MGAYNWAAALGDRGGEELEDLIATLLIRRHPDARQVNPSQGDGGRDVVRATDNGLEVWQIKKFAAALTASQWAQVKGSWHRFNKWLEEHGNPKVWLFHLVTPWTPTDERQDDFENLTADAPFKAVWDGEAYVNALVDDAPTTWDRFLHGSGNLERFITSKALLAASPVEQADSVSMLDAIETRQTAIDALRDTVSDHYRIDHAVRTVRNGSPPAPNPDDVAVYQTMTYLGNDRWAVDSIVPRSPSAGTADPIRLHFEFLDAPGTAEHQAVQDWLNWGIPFENVRARTKRTGGPMGDQFSEESTLSFVEVDRESHPDLLFTATAVDGSTRLEKRLQTVTATRGAVTDGLRITAKTRFDVVRMEFRAGNGAPADVRFSTGSLDGLRPADALRELDEILTVEESDVVSIEVESGELLLRGGGMTASDVLRDFHRAIAEGLVVLQEHATERFVMPDVTEVTVGELDVFKDYVAIYSGKPRVRTWISRGFGIPADASPEQLDRARRDIAELIERQAVPRDVERPRFALGNRAYNIQRPLVTTPHSVVFPELGEVLSLEPGDEWRLLPGDDNRITTVPLADWTPDNDLNF